MKIDERKLIKSGIVICLFAMIVVTACLYLQNRSFDRGPQPPNDVAVSKETMVDSGKEASKGRGFSFMSMGPDYLEEAGSSRESTDSNWWLDSGAWVKILSDGWESVQGDLPASSPWFKTYASSNAEDTDGGRHPQNILRLVSKKTYGDNIQQAYFYLSKYNKSESPNRNESNGILLFERYLDQDNLYYLGLRVDGQVVIKKKYSGNYTVLAEDKLLPGDWNQSTNPNLIPLNSWIGLKGETTNKNGGVEIVLSVDLSGKGDWREVLRAFDDSPGQLVGSGSVGIRTDFFDVRVGNYKVSGK